MRSSISLLTFLTLSMATQVAHAQKKGSTVAGGEFLYGSFNNPFAAIPAELDTTLIGIAAFATYQLSGDLTVGGTLPIAHRRFNESSSTSLGNITLDLRYRLSSRQASSGLTTSFSFPTSDDDGQSGVTAATFAFFWIPDPGLYLPNTTTFRFGYDHQRSFDSAFITFRIGLQYLSVDSQDDRVRIPIRVEGGIYLNPTVSVIGRFGTYWETSAEDDEENFFHVLEAGLQFDEVGDGVLTAMVYLPMDNAYRDDLETFGIKMDYQKAF